jgi:hypothetical protein
MITLLWNSTGAHLRMSWFYDARVKLEMKPKQQYLIILRVSITGRDRTHHLPIRVLSTTNLFNPIQITNA